LYSFSVKNQRMDKLHDMLSKDGKMDLCSNFIGFNILLISKSYSFFFQKIDDFSFSYSKHWSPEFHQNRLILFFNMNILSRIQTIVQKLSTAKNKSKLNCFWQIHFDWNLFQNDVWVSINLSMNDRAFTIIIWTLLSQ
jgi:hypothetical protein